MVPPITCVIWYSMTVGSVAGHIPLTVEFKSNQHPFRDCDTLDEIWFSSPHFGSCDTVKIPSVVPVEQYILVVIGLKFIEKICYLLAESPILGQNCHIWLLSWFRSFVSTPS